MFFFQKYNKKFVLFFQHIKIVYNKKQVILIIIVKNTLHIKFLTKNLKNSIHTKNKVCLI